MDKKYRQERPDRSKSKQENVQAPMNREETSETRIRQVIENEFIDFKYGFDPLKDFTEKTGFLINMHPNEKLNEDKRLVSCMDFYFLEDDGTRFKIPYPFMPYFYVRSKPELMQEVTLFLSKKYSGIIGKIEIISKEDLDKNNHLVGLKQDYIKLSFFSQFDMQKVRRELLKNVRKNKEYEDSNTFYSRMLASTLNNFEETIKNSDNMENIIDIREYDVPFHVRVSIDLKIFCGSWYTIKQGDPPTIISRPDIIERPEPIVLAFDIETTKLPLKFPDSSTDQIMMISYMIDGQGFLITNREILSQDIEDFEYTPKPEYEGKFTIFNKANEMELLEKFFDHIMDIRPHIFVTYNGDFFDWPFVEARAAIHDLDMKQAIGFSANSDGIYSCRPCIHMDCLCWVKRDSYLPVGSHGLKAVAKAKLRYDPVELDPEEMCALAANQPQVLSNYSVSDAVATYYLYMQYIHPFIFALCTIIPCEPEEVLRKGSGTLCEALLMVEAFHCNIIFPNKEQSNHNKLTEDGHVLVEETYVGGHVEALESGIFRADIPCRFRIDVEAIDNLIENVPKCLTHSIEVEEGVPLDQVINFNEIVQEIVDKLKALKEHPLKMEKPLIYHLDVGAMYPNIILTNRLQPCSIVNETICAACDFYKVGAECQRNMKWMSRIEYMPATRGEYQKIQQILETEKFPPQYPGGSQRAFHQLTIAEQAALEKKRLSIYCRKVYKKMKVTKVMERTTTICQKENSFYVDTVRAFRDRRYEYKNLSKKSKQEVLNAIKSGDSSEIRSAKNREILYDSLQLAHKCILNSFYGYVMRKGARWLSMEMAGIVCHTGANIIMKAQQIIEKVGRPLELDTDGIWCILPASFPDNFVIHTNHEKKKKLTISYPNAILNSMVKENFTNDQYYELLDSETLEYKKKNENSIFFEVDGPYRAMVLPASKEEGKKLKKRYAVFNFDGSIAELKGFEIKRRGELQLIKNFQSSVFDAFLKGDTLESCYAAVAQIADFWLDILFSHGRDLPDSDLFALISENRTMSKKLDEYEGQKSTSISTAKRLAEFLGDEMVKDAGLACKYVIAKKPDGAPIAERAIPLVIFHAEEAVKKHYLRKWLKDTSLNNIDIRDILDWSYYIERLGGTIQKIITIPAAMQGIPNPVPRVQHPEWLHKKIFEKNDNFRQKRIDDMFKIISKDIIDDIEDFGITNSRTEATIIKRKHIEDRDENQKKKYKNTDEIEYTEEELRKNWREVLGNPPSMDDIQYWLKFQKKKWHFQSMQRGIGGKQLKKYLNSTSKNSLSNFLQKAQRTLLTTPWQILQIVPLNKNGEFKLWILVKNDLHQIKLNVPRIFYANLKKPKEEEGSFYSKCNRILPRSKRVYNLYMYKVPEDLYQNQWKRIIFDLNNPDVEGIYETQTELLFKVLLNIGCVCKVVGDVNNLECFSMDNLEMVSLSKQSYLTNDSLKTIYFYNHKHPTKPQQIFALFFTPIKKALIIVVDTVRTNLLPNMEKLYQSERLVKINNNQNNDNLPPENITFQIHIETDLKQVYILINKAIQNYKEEKKAPTLLAYQTTNDFQQLQQYIPILGEFPQIKFFIEDIDELYNVLDWQRIGAKSLIRHYLNCESYLRLIKEQCRYFKIPLGNSVADSAIFGSDLFYARHLIKNNHVLWCSSTDRPDLGGSEENETLLLTEQFENINDFCNKSGWYSSVCVELDLDSLAISTLLQSQNIATIEGTSTVSAFDAVTTTSINELIDKNPLIFDESTKCADAFRILRIMASSLMRDVSAYRSVLADFQIIHFYRWLRSPKSRLYDPILLKTLQNLMRKYFLLLLAEIHRLGCSVIYANYNKIIICTKKHSIDDALAYVQFIIGSLRNKDLFHSLEITYRQCWEQLVWLDCANFAGIRGKLSNDLINEEETQNKVTEDDDDDEKDDEDDDDQSQTSTEIQMNWNLAEQLPETLGCQNGFNVLIAGYLSAVFSYLKQIQEKSIKITPIQSGIGGLSAFPDVIKYARDLINDEISQKLFKLIDRYKNYFKDSEVTLNFIKSFCHILSLDTAMKETVDNLKSNLLRLINISEFSDKAKWKDISVSYVIPEIICRICNHCRDIDLGRDQYRDDNGWLCPICKSIYDNAEIENLLIDIIHKKLLSYNLQDVQCKKCGEIKRENLIKHCQCAGEFITLMSRDDLIKLFNTFKSLANKFNMPTLEDLTIQILSLT